MSTPEYQPIPVEIAKHIADRFDKNTVVIVALDETHNCTHFTTYGVTAHNKVQAAAMAESINNILGAGEKIATFEDFGSVPAAESRATIERLEKELEQAKAALHVPGIWSCPKCGFTQHNRTLSAANGAIGVNCRPELRPCPNDGRDMQPVTWKELAKSNSRCAERIAGNYVALQRVAEGAEHMLRSLIAVRDGVPTERLEEMATALKTAHSKPAAA